MYQFSNLTYAEAPSMIFEPVWQMSSSSLASHPWLAPSLLVISIELPGFGDSVSGFRFRVISIEMPGVRGFGFRASLVGNLICVSNDRSRVSVFRYFGFSRVIAIGDGYRIARNIGVQSLLLVVSTIMKRRTCACRGKRRKGEGEG